MYKIVCAWCGCFMGGDSSADDDHTTHSICPSCKAAQEAEIEKYKNNKKK